VILLTIIFFVSLALPGVDVRVCFGFLPVAENQPPIAEARGSYKPTPSEKSIEITVGDTAYFDANMSKDTDGAIVEYIWDYGDGTFGEGFFTDHTYTSPGVYYVLLRVRDDKGAMSLLPSVVRVIVNPPLEVAPEVMRPVYEIAITTSLAPYVTTTTGDVTTTAFSDSTSTTYPGTTSSTELSSTSTSSAFADIYYVDNVHYDNYDASSAGSHSGYQIKHEKSYSDSQISSLEAKINDYQAALKKRRPEFHFPLP